MTSSIETLASAALSPVPLLLNGLRQISVAIIAARQKQADIRVAMHVRGLPRDVLQRLGLPTDAVDNLRHRARRLSLPLHQKQVARKASFLYPA
jgi:hypothetical protein